MMNYRGLWDAYASYNVDDVVTTTDGNWWVASVQNTFTSPSTYPTLSIWQPLGNTNKGGAGGVTSVTAGNAGITIGGTATAPTVSNAGVLSVTAGTGITIGGTTANPTISSAGGVTSVTAGNAGITIGGTTANPTVSNAGVLSVTAGNAGITIGGTTANPTVSNAGVLSVTAGTGITNLGTATAPNLQANVANVVGGTNITVSPSSGTYTVSAPNVVASPATSEIFGNGQIVASKRFMLNSASGLIPSTGVISTKITGFVDGGGYSETDTFWNKGFFVSYGGRYSILTFNANPNIPASVTSTAGSPQNYTCIDGNANNQIMGVDNDGLYKISNPFTSAPALISGTSPNRWIAISVATYNNQSFVAITPSTVWVSNDIGVTFFQNTNAPTGQTYVAVLFSPGASPLYLLTTTRIYSSAGGASSTYTAFGNTPTLPSGVTFTSFTGLASSASFTYQNFIVATSAGVLYRVSNPGTSAVWTAMTAVANDGTLVSGTIVNSLKVSTESGGCIVGTPNGKIYVLQNSVITDPATTTGNNFYNTSPYNAFTDTTGSYWIAIPSLNKPWSALAIGGLNPRNSGAFAGALYPTTTKIYAGSTNDSIYTGNSGNSSTANYNGNGANTIDADVLNITTSTIWRANPFSALARATSLMPFTAFGRATGTTTATGFVTINLATSSSYYKAFSYQGNGSYAVSCIAVGTSTTVANIATITFSVRYSSGSSFDIYWAGNTLLQAFSIDWVTSGL